MSEYQFTETQQNAIAAPDLGQHFALQDSVFTATNASIKAHYGTSSADQISFDAANRQMFNPYGSLGVTCPTVNAAAARPDLGASGPGNGSACPAPSPSFNRAMSAMDSGFNAYGPSASQVVLAEGDVRYAPARFVDQNNFAGPSVSDFTYQSRLMGTRDSVSSGCATDLDAGITMCALRDDPLPYPESSDPRTAYGVDEPRSQYWDGGMDGGYAAKMCNNMGNSEYPYSLTSMCNLESVEAGPAAHMLSQYNGVRAANGMRAGNNGVRACRNYHRK